MHKEVVPGPLGSHDLPFDEDTCLLDKPCINFDLLHIHRLGKRIVKFDQPGMGLPLDKHKSKVHVCFQTMVGTKNSKQANCQDI